MSYCLNFNCQQPQNLKDAIACQSCGFKLIFKKRYRPLQVLDRGDRYRTFLAVDESKNQPCVIQQFIAHGDHRNSAQAIELFKTELQLLAKLGHHPHLPDLLDNFERDNCLYLVRAYIDGQNLAEEVSRCGVFSELQVMQFLADLLPTIQYLHDQQVIHCYIQPQTIIHQPNDQYCLTNFGFLSNIAPITAEYLNYAAPEQIRGRATFASDLYALGVTSLYLLTKVAPVDLISDRQNNWIWQEQLSNKVSTEFLAILNKMVDGALDRRYQTVPELLNAVSNHLHKLQLQQSTTPDKLSHKQGEVLKPVQLGDSMWGYENSQGQVISNSLFEAVREFSEGRAAVKLTAGWGFIDSTGKIVIKPQFCEVSDFSESLASGVLTGSFLYGFIDTKGDIAIPYQFGKTGDFHEGLARVTQPSRSKFGFIDRQGNLVIDYQFDDAEDFHEGLAKIGLGRWYGGYGWKFEGHYGFIDKLGNVVVPAEFDEVSNFQDGLAKFKINLGTRLPKQGFIDRHGKHLIELQCYDLKFIAEDIAAFKLDPDGDWGLVNPTGIISKPKFKEVRSLQKGYVKVLTKSFLGSEKWETMALSG